MKTNKELKEYGFNEDQITIIQKISDRYYIDNYIGETNSDYSYINQKNSVESLRILKNTLLKFKFDNGQVNQIIEGFYDKINYIKYADNKYNLEQMAQIRVGLIYGIDLTIYCNELYNREQMYWIKFGLKHNLNITHYLDLNNTWKDMKRLYHILLYNIDNPTHQYNIELFKNNLIDNNLKEKLNKFCYIDLINELNKLDYNIYGLLNHKLNI